MNQGLIKFDIRPKHHVLFWLSYFSLNFLRWGAYFNDYVYSFKSNLLEFSLHIPFVYFNLLVLIPAFLLKSKYKTYVLALLGCLAVIYLLKTGLTYVLITKYIWPEANREYHPFDINHIVAVVIGELYVLAMASSVYLTLKWLRERERNRALNEEQLKMKVKNLEIQIQPHFFFNTLNNLYSLSLSKSTLVPNTIIKLSKLMKYVLYDIKDNESVPLINEFDYIQNYIDIEKLRFKNIEVTTNISANIDKVMVPPMIFINFIENAIKHGGYNEELRIKINCYIEDEKYLIFEVINNFVNSPLHKNTSGIGIENVVNRLKLLYQNDFNFRQRNKFNYFIIELKMPIKYEN